MAENNPMVGMTVDLAVTVEENLKNESLLQLNSNRDAGDINVHPGIFVNQKAAFLYSCLPLIDML